MINRLKPYYVGEKIRLGNLGDGGYVLPKQVLEESECLFSYGISDDITFDEHYIQLTNKKVYGYDHTIESVHTNYPDNFFLHKEGISGTSTEVTSNFLKHYADKQCSGRVLLKIDVEGCEYEWLLNTDIQQLANVTTGIVIEFHDINDETFRNIFVNCMEELNKHFYICHIHGNNYGGTFQYEELNFPSVLELTFVPKAIITEVSPSTETFPTVLDSSNDVNVSDINLNFI
jgi:hypothetical protein